MALKKTPLLIREMCEALGDFTALTVTDQLCRLHGKRYPRSYLNTEINKTIHYYIRTGKVEVLTTKKPRSFRWKSPPSGPRLEVLPPKPPPPMDLTDYNQQSDYWKDQSRNVKP